MQGSENKLNRHLSAITVVIVSKGKTSLILQSFVKNSFFFLFFIAVKAMYQDTHPEYINYLYLMIPISLVILNPIGFVLLEIQKQRSNAKSQGSSTLKIILTAFKGVATDPIVFMTFIGLVGHFILDGNKLPQVLEQIFSALGQAFLATALFYLGVKMVGNMKTKVGSGLVVPLLLITAKS